MIATRLTPDQVEWLARFGYGEQDDFVTLQDGRIMKTSLVCEVRCVLLKIQQQDISLFVRLGIATDNDSRMPRDREGALESYSLVGVNSKGGRAWLPDKLTAIQTLLTVDNDGNVGFAEHPLQQKEVARD